LLTLGGAPRLEIESSMKIANDTGGDPMATPRRFTLLAAALLLAANAGRATAAVLDLERLDGPTAIEMMEEGKLTSVKLTKAYLARIEALNKRGPGLNAVTQLNKDVLKEAAQMDAERKAGIVRGPAHGLPVLL
jgi:hypothetical protein